MTSTRQAKGRQEKAQDKNNCCEMEVRFVYTILLHLKCEYALHMSFTHASPSTTDGNSDKSASSSQHSLLRRVWIEVRVWSYRELLNLIWRSAEKVRGTFCTCRECCSESLLILLVNSCNRPLHF